MEDANDTVDSSSTSGRPGDRPETGGPAVIGANWYRFRASERIHHAEVASVSFIWLRSGQGKIRSGGTTVDLDRTTVLRLPWRHEVIYQADARTPFQLGTVHLLPWHASDAPLTPHVPHRKQDPLLTASWRQGGEDRQNPLLLSSRSSTGNHLISLGSYCIERFMEEQVDEETLRALGVLLAKVDAAAATADPESERRPVALELMMNHVLENLGRPLSVDEIAEAGDCSTSTAERLFRKHTNSSVLAWVRQRRMAEAALLLRTSGLRVSEVASQVGFNDPLYFSRVFRSIYSIPPSQYASEQMRP